jgi:4-amino-4-deoxy-L-arabinose transferase-like glycosyltransferase
VTPERKARLLLAAILVAAAAPRIYFTFSYSEDEFLTVDAVEYRDIAANLANGDGFSISFYRWFEPVDPAVEPLPVEFDQPEILSRLWAFRPPVALRPDFYRPPLLPLVGAALFRLPGSWDVWSRPAAVALGLAAILGVYWVASLAFNRATGLIAAALLSLDPYAVFYTAHWSTELLGLPVLLAFVGLALLSRRDGFRARHLLLLGAVGGLAALTRPNLIVSVGGLIAWLALVAPSWRAGLRSAAICGLGLFLVLAPWTLRNYSHLRVVQPLTSLGPYMMWVGMNEYVYNQYTNTAYPRTERGIAGEKLQQGSDRRVRSLEERGITGVLEVNDFWNRETLDFVQQSPAKAAYVVGARFIHFWSPFPTRRSWMSDLEYYAGLLSTGSLMILALCTLLLLRPPAAVPLVLPAVLSSIAALPFFFAFRYRLPVFDPYLGALAAYAVFRGGVGLLRRLQPDDAGAASSSAGP